MSSAPDTQTTQPPLWRRIGTSLWRLEPIRHSRWEVVLIRLLFAAIVWDTQSGWVAYWTQPTAAVRAMVQNPKHFDIRHDSQPHPNGLAHFFDFTPLADDRIEKPLRYAMGASLVLYVLGVPALFSLAIPLFFSIGDATLNNSQGSIGHTAQGLHLALLAAWLAGLYAFIQRRRGRALKHGCSSGELEIDWARQALAATYVVSAISKLIISKGLWFVDAKYFALHVLKNNEMQYYNLVDPAARKLHWLPEVMLQHPHWCQFLFGIALPLELFAFIALRNRRAAALFGVTLIAFHESVTQLTQLSFIFNKMLLLVLFVAPWWWLARWLRSSKNA